MTFSATVFCRKIILWFLIGLFAMPLSASIVDQLRVDFRFIALPNSHKLSNLVIKDIIQDRDGFVWIATDDGLNRYDGEENVVYRPSNDHDGSISHFFITSLAIDSTGVLWVGTEDGLNRYDATLDRFEKFTIEPDNKSTGHNSNVLADSRIRTLFADSANRLWVGSKTGGVDLISPDRLSITHVALSDASANSAALYIHDFIETNTNLLVATKRGLFQYQTSSNTLLLLPGTADKNILTLFDLGNNTLLLGSAKGLFEFNQTTHTLTAIVPKTLQDKLIVDIWRFDEDRYFIGTRRSGLYLLDLNADSNKGQSKHALKSFKSDPSDKYGLNDNQINTIYQSSEGLYWFGTNVGIDIVDPNQQRFGHIKSSAQYTDCLSGNTVYAILRDSRNRLWVGSFGHGLHQINLDNGQCRKLVHSNSTTGSPLLKDVVSLYEDEYGDIWIGTYGEGVVRYNTEQDNFSVFNSNQVKRPKAITAITGDGKGKVWIATYHDGIFELNLSPRNGQKPVPIPIANLPKRLKEINGLAVDAKGNLWIASAAAGLWLYEPSLTTAGQPFKSFDNVPQLLWSVYPDNDNNLWIGSKGEGAFKLTPSDNTVKKYAKAQGLLSNVVSNIQQDAQGNMWFFTDKGLSRLSPQDNTILTFLEKDGMQGDTFTTAGFYDSLDNVMWAGGTNGINRFNPVDILPSDHHQRVKITHFELFYKPVTLIPGAANSLLTQVIGQTDTIKLNYKQNVFAFGFSALAFFAPEQIKYGFMLQGYDTDWNIVSADRRFANYTNIDPGEYVFKVKAANKAGQWGPQQTTINITIAPPWWQTKLALASYGLLLVIALYLIVAFRTRLLTTRANKLEKSVALRTLELATEKKKVEQLLARKHEEFATVSHEFRTPLTLILGPLTQVLSTIKNEQTLKRLNIVQRNANRLLRMVDQLLNLETFRVKAINQKSTQPSGQIIRLLSEAFVDLAKEKNLDLQVNHICDVDFSLVPDALEKIVLNLLSNAIKYTKSGGIVTVMTQRTPANELNIKVADNGIGIPPNMLGAVVERYQRVQDEHSEHVTGAGIGLALVKSLVEVHQGRLEIHSELGKGTTVDVFLPIINEVTHQTIDIQDRSINSNTESVTLEMMSIAKQTPAASSTDIVQQSNDEPSVDKTINTHKPLVLVIEDNSDMRSYIEQSIAHQYQVITANDGEAGLDIAIAQVPDLIISDIMMPKKDGYQTTKALRNNSITNHIPVILLTAKGDRDSRIKGWREKADEYLTKPFDAQELNIRLSNLLAIRNILKKRFGETTFESTELLTEPVTQARSDNASTSAEKEPYQENVQEAQQRQFIEKLNTVIETIYTQPGLSINDFADKMAMSERQLFRKLKSIVDITPTEYLRRYRLEKAKLLLIQGQSVSFVTFEVGFSSQSYFGKCFKAQFGVSPSDFKKNST